MMRLKSHNLIGLIVFPWVLADYTSEYLDLEQPRTFRDLSKPMGAIGLKRAEQYSERFQSMIADGDAGISDSRPFHYGTHYSCAGYVLHYLVRLQPFSDMAVELQGGTFDKPDRLFRSVESSWVSASTENLQDVKELIPEFFSFPNFLLNSNRLDLGITQNGDIIGDVILPQWAHGDPVEFVNKHREALECRYVSEHLHEWIDLIFGYKQQGKEAEAAMNVFIHLTYAGEVDIDAISDPVYRNAVISQINNFGQTPNRLFTKPHPKRIVPDVMRSYKENMLADAGALLALERTTPPLCVVGAPEYSYLSRISHSQYLADTAVGDVLLNAKDRLIVLPFGNAFASPKNARYLHFNSAPGKVSFHDSQALGTANQSDEVSSHILHSRQINCVAFADHGMFATGSEDMTSRLWAIRREGGAKKAAVQLVGVLVGHSSAVTCIDICKEFSILVTGSFDRRICCFDTTECKLIRVMGPLDAEVESVSINKATGNICGLTATNLYLFTINGRLLAKSDASSVFRDRGTVVLAIPCVGWKDGVVAVTGHARGNVHLWRMRRANIRAESGESNIDRSLYVSYTLAKVHRGDITCLKLCSTSGPQKSAYSSTSMSASNTDLFVGDLEGYVSRWCSNRLDQLPQSDIMHILKKNSS